MGLHFVCRIRSARWRKRKVATRRPDRIPSRLYVLVGGTQAKPMQRHLSLIPYTAMVLMRQLENRGGVNLIKYRGNFCKQIVVPKELFLVKKNCSQIFSRWGEFRAITPGKIYAPEPMPSNSSMENPTNA